jgi:hypothetical protein
LTIAYAGVLSPLHRSAGDGDEWRDAEKRRRDKKNFLFSSRFRASTAVELLPASSEQGLQRTDDSDDLALPCLGR